MHNWDNRNSDILGLSANRMQLCKLKNMFHFRAFPNRLNASRGSPSMHVKHRNATDLSKTQFRFGQHSCAKPTKSCLVRHRKASPKTFMKLIHTSCIHIVYIIIQILHVCLFAFLAWSGLVGFKRRGCPQLSPSGALRKLRRAWRMAGDKREAWRRAGT